MNKLREAREFTFQYLFHLQLPVFESIKKELILDSTHSTLKDSIAEFKNSTNSMFDSETNKFIEDLIVGTLSHYDKVEEIISKNLKNWKISRLSKVDKTNLLIATYEISYVESTPINIVINEAVEISKKFGSAESASFTNGVLDNIAKNKIQ